MCIAQRDSLNVVLSDTPVIELAAPSHIARIGRQLLAELPWQLNYAFLLTPTHQLIAIAEVARADDPEVAVRDVFRLSLLDRAASVAFCGLRTCDGVVPQGGDHALTEALSQAGRILGVPLFDHVIVDATEYYSFRELGVL